MRVADVILDIKDGGTPSRKNPEYFGGDVYWCVVKDIKPLIFDTAEKLTEDGLNNCSAKVWPVDSVIISLGATIGQIGIAKVPTATKQGLAGIVLNRQMMTPEFLAYGLLGQKEYIQSLATGATIKEIRPTRFAETIQIPVPPLAEQQRIVGLLDEAFEGLATAKANAEKNLQNARTLFESHLQSVFTQRGPGWVEKKLEEIGKTQTGSTPKTSDQSNYGDFISFVKPGDFNTDGTLDYDKDGLSESGAEGARKVPAGSVLMVCIGATIGKCGYCDQDVTTNQQVNALTPSDGSSNRFIYYQMLTETFQRKVIHASGQATLPIINKSKWSALSVWLPPKVAEQKKIAAKFDALVEETQRLAAIYERKAAALDALKKSLLHQAFSGNL